MEIVSRLIQRTLLMRLVLLILLRGNRSFAALTKLQMERNETVLGDKAFGLAGAYRKIVGKAHFALDPAIAANKGIVDLGLAPKNSAGLVEFSADFYLLIPADPARSKGKLFYEVGNQGRSAHPAKSAAFARPCKRRTIR